VFGARLPWPAVARRGAVIGRLAWGVVIVPCLVVAGAAFIDFAGSGLPPLVAGPLAVNPALSGQLVALFGGDDLLRAGQVAVHVTGFLLYVATGMFIVVRRPATTMPLLGSVMLVLVGTSLFAPLAVFDGTGWEPAARLIGTASPGALGTYWASLAGMSVVVFFLLFPDGRWSPSWGRWVVAGLAMVGVAAVAADLRIPSGVQQGLGMLVPAGLIAAQAGRQSRDPGSEAMRRARPVVWSFTLVLGVFGVIWAVSPELSSDAFELVLATPRLQAVYDVNLLILLTATVFALPLSIWVAIARYRLFDIDLIVNRALVYGSVTLMVGAGLAAALATIALVLDGPLDPAMSPVQAALGGALSGVIVVAVFRPLRNRLQEVVDRRFYPSKYQIDRAIGLLAASAEDTVSIEELVAGVRAVIEEGFSPERLEVRVPGLLDPALDEQVEVTLRGRGAVVLEAGGALSGLAGDWFDVAVPFVSQRRLVAVALLGAPASGRYSALDLEQLDRLAGALAPPFRLGELVRRQEAAVRDQERLAGEMATARRIQTELLPRELPQPPGWSVDVYYRPAREVGGDFYDVVARADGRVTLVVGDVSGKGVPAAMVMTVCRTLLRGATESGRSSPGEVLARVNDLLGASIPAGMFVTCLLGFLDPAAGRLVFANAGHDLPYVKRHGSIGQARATGMPLGLMPGMPYEESEVEVQPGETLILTTDGLIEVHNPDGAMLGFERFAEMVGQAPEGSNLIPGLLSRHRDFTGPEWEQEDDITLLTVRRH
jgi:hypothetical protein